MKTFRIAFELISLFLVLAPFYIVWSGGTMPEGLSISICGVLSYYISVNLRKNVNLKEEI